MVGEALHPSMPPTAKIRGRGPTSSASLERGYRALLGHLESVGFSYSPRLVGSADGHDVLSFIPGRSGADGWAPAVDERGLIAGARLLRAYHDAVR